MEFLKPYFDEANSIKHEFLKKLNLLCDKIDKEKIFLLDSSIMVLTVLKTVNIDIFKSLSLTDKDLKSFYNKIKKELMELKNASKH